MKFKTLKDRYPLELLARKQDPQLDLTLFKSGITRLNLENFRLFESISFKCDTRPVVIWGENGSGKTSLLEAISLFAPGRGLRGVKLNEIENIYAKNRVANHANHNHLGAQYNVQNNRTSPLWTVSVLLENDGDSISMGTCLVPGESKSDKRVIQINEDVVKNQASLTQWMGIIWITPQMNHLFTEPAAARRKFIDRLVATFDVDHISRLNRYEYHIRERSILLKQGRYDERWINTLEEKIAQDGIAIEVARTLLIEKLNLEDNQSFNPLFPKFCARMIGSQAYWHKGISALEAEGNFVNHLKIQRSVDAQYGGASIGPHKDDLEVTLLKKNLPADLCSTGEQKMLIISILLAFARIQLNIHDPYFQKPLILLLDDIAAHLDENHRFALFNEIYQLKLQAWFTGVEYATFELLQDKAQFFHLNESTLTQG